jgi:hypothetical protein
MKSKTRNYVFLSDPGHGWLIVPVSHVIEAGCAEKITSYSYLKMEGGTQYAYLEEDCDAPTFLNAAKEKGWEITITENYVEYTSIRNFPAFHIISLIS